MQNDIKRAQKHELHPRFLSVTISHQYKEEKTPRFLTFVPDLFQDVYKVKKIFFTKQLLLHLSLLGCYILSTGKWSLTFLESVLPQSKDRTVFLD